MKLIVNYYPEGKGGRGGLRNPPGGRPPKPPTTKAKRRLITLPPEIDTRLENLNASELITKLLKGYFESIDSL